MVKSEKEEKGHTKRSAQVWSKAKKREKGYTDAIKQHLKIEYKIVCLKRKSVLKKRGRIS